MPRPKRAKSDKEQQRFYLFPGQGGRSYRRKQNIILLWSVIAALVVSLALAGLFYFLNRTHPL